MVLVDIDVFLSSSSSPTIREEGHNNHVQPHSPQSSRIHSLEREFIQVRQHIKLLIQKKTKLLRELRNQINIKSTRPSEQEILDRWKDISTRYLYAFNNTSNNNNNNVHDSDSSFPLFNILPNEVLLHIFSYLSAPHLCKVIMRVCGLFCAVALDESLWKPLYYLNWGDHRTSVIVNRENRSNNTLQDNNNNNTITWRSLFTIQSHTESNWWSGSNQVNTLEGHKGAVRCMQFAGDMLATGSTDKTIKLWNLESRECTQTLHDNKWIRCLRMDVPSSVLVTTCMDSTQAKIWDLKSNSISHVLDVFRGWITCLQLNMPNLVTGSLDGLIRVWDISGKPNIPSIVVNSGHDSLRSICQSGDLILSAGLERNLQLWDLRAKPSAKPSLAVVGASNGNYCVQFDTYTHTVVSGSKGTVAVADLRVPNLPPDLLKGHKDIVSCLQFTGKKLVTGSMDQTIRVWDLNERSCAYSLYGHESWVWDLQIDPDKIVSVSGDNSVKLWSYNHPLDMRNL